jgi:hypothetical protein
MIMFINLGWDVFLTLQAFLNPSDIKNIRLLCRALRMFPSDFHAQRELEHLIKILKHDLVLVITPNQIENSPYHLKITKLMRFKHVDPSICLAVAAAFNYTNILDYLILDKKVDPSRDDNEALVLACRHGQLTVVERLLRDPRLDLADNDVMERCLENAVTGNHLSVIRLLLKGGRVIPRAKRSLHLASVCGYVNIVELLLTVCDPRSWNSFSLTEAVLNGHLEVVKLLVSDPRIDPAVNNNLALQQAAFRGHTEIVRFLVADERVDPSQYKNVAVRVYRDCNFLC